MKIRFICLDCGKSGRALVREDSELHKALVRCNYQGKEEITVEDCKDLNIEVLYFHKQVK